MSQLQQASREIITQFLPSAPKRRYRHSAPSIRRAANDKARMRSNKLIQIVACHCEGEVGDVIVSGVAPPPGETIWELSRFIAQDGELRNFLLHEPRAGVHRHINLLAPPKNPTAQGFKLSDTWPLIS